MSRAGGFLAVGAPLLFVFLWSTGFIGTKAAALNADPFAFLLVRFVLAALIMSALTVSLRTPWPAGVTGWHHAAVSGLLLHAGYLGAVTYAMFLHLPAGVTSVVVGLQPLLTGLLSGPLLGERVTGRQWTGLLLGFLGVLLIVLGKERSGGTVQWAGLAWAVVALGCTTAGTLYQKKHGANMPLLGGTAVQFLACVALLAVIVLVRGGGEIHWNTPFILALGWLVLALSVGAILLLMYLIREMPAARVSSLMYLVPPLTVIEAYLLFGERLSMLGVVGLALCVLGVALAAVPGKRT